MSLIDAIKKGENKKIEFKQEIPSGVNIAKTVIAFANTSGGRIFIGVNDKGQITGCNELQIANNKDKIANIIYDAIHPLIVPDIYTYALEGKIVIVIEVYPSNVRPHFLKTVGKMEGTFIRLGATNRKADIVYIQELERQRNNISYDSEVAYFQNAAISLIKKLKKILADKFKKKISKFQFQF